MEKKNTKKLIGLWNVADMFEKGMSPIEITEVIYPKIMMSYIASSDNSSITDVKKLFIAMVPKNDEREWIDLYLVNNADIEFSKVNILTGADGTFDGKLVETGKSYKEVGSLGSFSLLLIGGTDKYELDDFIVWYNIDVYPNDSVKPLKLVIGLYHSELFKLWEKPEDIPLLNKKGYILPLSFKEQTGIPISDEIKGVSLEPRY